jgi:hypothetical protein
MKSEIKYIPIKQLKAWGKNPRKNDKAAEKLVKLIEAHGFINPVICTRDNTIRAGHTRVKAANKAGLKEVPVIYVDMDEEQASAFAIADNKSSQYSEWDFELLKNVFEELDAFNYDLELTGFDMAEAQIYFEVNKQDAPDYSILDDELDDKLTEMGQGVKKAIQIEFNNDDYKEAYEIISFWRKQGNYVGGMIIDYLKAEKDKL